MNWFLLFDVVSLVLLIFIAVLFVRIRKDEDRRYHGMLNALLFGMFFVMVYFLLDIVSFLLARYSISDSAVMFTADLFVLPLAAIFFFVSVLIRE
jgi:hypothetical protein